MVVNSDSCFVGPFAELASAFVPIQQVRSVVVGDVNVGPAIGVQIGDRHAESFARSERYGCRNVLEAFARIAIQRMRQRFETLGRADVAFPGRPVTRTNRIVVLRPIKITAHIEIQSAVPE